MIQCNYSKLVDWKFEDGHLLPNYRRLRRGNRHSLIIENITHANHGMYTCASTDLPRREADAILIVSGQ